MAKKTNADEVVILENPIKRGEQEVREVTLRKPASGELRGLKLMEIAQMDVASLIVLLPRISSPMLTENDVSSMDPSDLMQCAAKVTNFLLPIETKMGVSQPA